MDPGVIDRARQSLDVALNLVSCRFAFCVLRSSLPPCDFRHDAAFQQFPVDFVHHGLGVGSEAIEALFDVYLHLAFGQHPGLAVDVDGRHGFRLFSRRPSASRRRNNSVTGTGVRGLRNRSSAAHNDGVRSISARRLASSRSGE
jgi:hypothetical protein